LEQSSIPVGSQPQPTLVNSILTAARIHLLTGNFCREFHRSGSMNLPKTYKALKNMAQI